MTQSAIRIPKKLGDRAPCCPTKWGKSMVRQNYENPKGGPPIDMYLFDGGGITPSIGIPITADRKIIVIEQFRHGADEVIFEYPGGCPKPGQTPQDVFSHELEEETGYKAGAITCLSEQPFWIEPAALTVGCWPFIATNCMLVSKQKLDETEDIVVHLFPAEEWLDMVLSGKVKCGKTIAITMLAWRRLQKILNPD